jgi:hypothetical protein
MLTSQSAYQGEDITEIFASVVKGGADFELLPANLHSRVREALSRCLQKDLKRRYPDITDARYEIEQVLADPGGVLVQPVRIARPHKKLQLGVPWIVAAVAAVAIIVGLAVWNFRPESQKQRPLITRFALDADGFGSNHGMALSADGSKLVYAADKEGTRQLFLRARDQMSPVPIRDTKDAVDPFFSPDGNWVGFFNGTELKKVSLYGGVSQPLCKAIYRLGASWGADGTIVFATSDSPGLMSVSAFGGEPKVLTKSEFGPGTHRWPEFTPDGKHLLYTIFNGTSNWQIAVLSLETKKTRVLVDGTDAHFAPPGHLIFARESTLWAVPFDSIHLELKGEAAPIIEDVQVNSGGWGQYALASDGSLVYLPRKAQLSSLICHFGVGITSAQHASQSLLRQINYAIGHCR